MQRQPSSQATSALGNFPNWNVYIGDAVFVLLAIILHHECRGKQIFGCAKDFCPKSCVFYKCWVPFFQIKQCRVPFLPVMCLFLLSVCPTPFKALYDTCPNKPEPPEF